MTRSYFQRVNPSLKDKIFAFDFTLCFLILLLGIISLFAMYSSERGNFSYHTQSHLYRFTLFFLLFIIISFLRIQFWYKSAYFFYFTVLILLFGVDLFGVTDCEDCNGTGQVTRVSNTILGQMQTSSPCPHCSGNGQSIDKRPSGTDANGMINKKISVVP